ncbi:MAG: hypothetical protein AB8G11_06670 [Saprospiraceae bacterium]
MIDLLIINKAGTAPVTIAQSNDPINARDLHVVNLDHAVRIQLGNDYQVGYDNNTHMIGRTCTELNQGARTATFTMAL